MDTRSITCLNLETGETLETNVKLSNNKFKQRGHTMYNYGIDYMLDRFTNSEIKKAISMFDTKFVDYNNILTVKFSQILPYMDSSDRSKLKKKLIENMVIQEHNKLIMLNPYIFIPRGDKNIQNSQYLTQRVWKYLFEDCNIGSDDVVRHAEHMFGSDVQIKIRVGKGKFSKTIEC